MLDRFDAPNERIRRTWVRWCELEADLARAAYHTPARRRTGPGPEQDRYHDAIQRVYHARGSSSIRPGRPAGAPGLPAELSAWAILRTGR